MARVKTHTHSLARMINRHVGIPRATTRRRARHQLAHDLRAHPRMHARAHRHTYIHMHTHMPTYTHLVGTLPQPTSHIPIPGSWRHDEAGTVEEGGVSLGCLSAIIVHPPDHDTSGRYRICKASTTPTPPFPNSTGSRL